MKKHNENYIKKYYYQIDLPSPKALHLLSQQKKMIEKKLV